MLGRHGAASKAIVCGDYLKTKCKSTTCSSATHRFHCNHSFSQFCTRSFTSVLVQTRQSMLERSHSDGEAALQLLRVYIYIERDMHMRCSVGILWHYYRGHLGPGAQSGQKEESKWTIFQLSWLFCDSMLDLLDRQHQEGPGTHFGLFLLFWARRAQMTPVADKNFSQL